MTKKIVESFKIQDKSEADSFLMDLRCQYPDKSAFLDQVKIVMSQRPPMTSVAEPIRKYFERRAESM